MREISVPPLVNIAPPETNITDLVIREAEKASNPALFSKLDGNGQWQDIRAKDFLQDVRALAKGLIASGVGVGDRVGIMSRTRYEWSLVDFAIWFAGASLSLSTKRRRLHKWHGTWATQALLQPLAKPRTMRTSSARLLPQKTSLRWPTSGSLRAPDSMRCALQVQASPTTNSSPAVPQPGSRISLRLSTPPVPPAGPRAAN